MSIRLVVSAVGLIAAAGSMAIGQQTSPADAAKAFTLDSVSPTPTPTPTPMSAPTVAESPVTPSALPPPTLATPAVPDSVAIATPTEAAAPASPVVRAVFTLDTPIQDLIADAAAKAVLDKDLPGMSDDENLDKFKMLSLRSLQPQTGGQLTDAMLMKVATDLDVLGGGTGAVMPIRAGNSKRNGDASR